MRTLTLWIGLAMCAASARASAFSYMLFSYPGSGATTGGGVNDSMQIAGTSYSGTEKGFVMSGSSYQTVSVPGAGNQTFAMGINDGGTVVGEYAVNNSASGFEKTGPDYETLTAPGASSTLAVGVSNSGMVVGSAWVGSAMEGFVLNGTNWSMLSDPGAVNGTFATGVNSGGVVVGYGYNSSYQASGFEYTGGKWSTISAPGATQTVVSGINDSGEMTGYYVDASGNVHGFLFDGTEWQTLDVPVSGAETYASGINNMGDVVGTYEKGGVRGGFLIVPVTPAPEPGTWAMLVSGLGLVGLFVWRRRVRAERA